jgi:eukaryotic-like serine/threonine-protein kinase
MTGSPPAGDPLDHLLDHLLELPPSEREAALSRCDDPGLAGRARRLLALEGESFLQGGIAAVAPELLRDLTHDLPVPADPYPPGTPVGGYRVVRRLGQGGMGTVYLAERHEGDFARRVALKVIGAGPASGELLRRFLAERRILATLEHPNIARLYDAGVSARGDPFFVMEYVEGERIDRYCASRVLSVERRLDLFLQVCDATEHAHRRLVVHRDLKPGNVLVTPEGQVRLLDFGVARILRPEDDPGNDPPTRGGALTPEYASPEQLLGHPVSTSSDVYALGILLYELLTGERPHAFPDRSPVEVARALQERLPTLPSRAVLGRPGGEVGMQDLAAGRRLSRRLSGDLDAIVLTALRPDPGERYPSVAALRDDVVRHAEGRRVLARPATPGYRARLFLRRNRGAVVGGALLALALAAGVVTSLWQAGEARRQALQARRVTEALVTLFESADPDLSAGRPLTARDLLERGEAALDPWMGGEPGTRGELLAILARLHASLGGHERSAELAARAVSLHREGGRRSAGELARSLRIHGAALLALAAYDSAEATIREALALDEAREREPSAELAASRSALASVLSRTGRLDEAEPLYRAALAAAEARGDAPAMAGELSNLGVLLQRMSRYDESLPLLERAVALHGAPGGGRPTSRATAQLNLAETLRLLGRFQEADSVLTEVIALRTALLGPEHPDVALALNNRGEVLREADRLDEALEVHLQALAMRQEVLGAGHPMVAASLNNVAIVRYFRRELDDAARGFEEARDIFSSTEGPAHAHTVSAINNLAAVRRQQGRLEEAEAAFRDLVLRTARDGGEGSFGWTTAVHNLGWTLLERGRPEEAREAFRTAVDHFRTLQGRHPNTGTALGGLGRAELELDRAGQAEPALREAVDILASTLDPGSLRTADHRVWLGIALLELGRREEGRAVVLEGLEPIARERGPDDPVRVRGEAALRGGG